VELIVLGSGGTWPASGGATSGYLVRQDGFDIWMDAGSGTMGRLQQHVEVADLDALLITHGHPDHFVDLYSCFYARFYGGLGEGPLPLYAPSGFFERAARLVSEESRPALEAAFDVHELEPGSTLELGPFRVTAREMAHIGVNAAGFRIEGASGVLAYTGDSGPTEEVVTLAKGADLLLSEATWQDHMPQLPFHMSARQAGEHAAAAGAGALLLTHIWPTLDTAASVAQASEAFFGRVGLAIEGDRVLVGR
jgi:ribonuclease BN (tRNA processing enzyme)